MIGTIGLQLYSVRDALAVDFEGTIEKIASYGYRAVETAGFPPGMTPSQAKALFERLGMSVAAAHSGLPLGENQNAVIDGLKEVGAEYLVCAWLDPNSYYQSLDGIKRACELLNEGSAIARAHDLKLVYHNHWFEMQPVEGRIAYKHMLDYLDADVLFEIDTYWAKVAGLDPVQVIGDLKERLPLLHLKDGPTVNTEDSMLALGTGAMDVPAILAASPARWHIVELDRCDTDMLDAVRESYAYLKRLSA